MCIKNAIQLSLDGDTFSALKKDFDAVLLRTVGNMESKSADEATITLKLTISLEKERTNFGEEPKQITRPTFKHDISSVMQVKDKVSGTLKEDYELVFDDEEGKYVMRRISNGQMTIFETVEEQEEDAVEYVNAPAVLPAPSEPAVIEATAEAVVEDIEDEDEQNETTPGPFEWLRQFVGSPMHVTENMGNFAVRTDGNKIVLTSSTTPDSPFFCPAEKLEPHVGHKLVCVGYGVEELLNISIECEDCNETLYDLDAPISDEDDEEIEEDPIEDDLEEDLDDMPEDYDYDEPDEA